MKKYLKSLITTVTLRNNVYLLVNMVLTDSLEPLYVNRWPSLGLVYVEKLHLLDVNSGQAPDKPALAWVACPGILHRS